jgi:FkbM family methyltransferase
MNLTEYEQIHPHITVDGLVFLTPNQHCAWRVDTLYTKEPDTIAWINAMQPGDVLYDVGANMGQYSLYAAKRGIRVHAFEPESQNFALLCRNIALNKLGDLITPWPVALTDKEGLDTFHVTSLVAGGSCNSFGEAVDYHLKEKTFAFQQGCYGITLDLFTLNHTAPAHIKIDVDGLEHKVLTGAMQTLAHCPVRSVLVETNTALPEHRGIDSAMQHLGYLPDSATAEVARRKEGPFTGIGNVIYYREINK